MISESRKKINIFGAIALPLLLNIAAIPATSQSLQSLSLNDRNHDTGEIYNQQLASANVGKFQLIYEPNTQHNSTKQLLQNSGLFERVVNNLNSQNLNLPVDIPVVFSDCGRANAFYIPLKKEIVMCYELFPRVAQTLTETYSTQEEVELNSMLVLVFVLYHEAGHALTDVLQLAVTGKEEDAVDDFASILLLNENDSIADRIILNSSIFFFANSADIYWDEHSFGKQRFYNMICLLYGKSPDKYASLKSDLEGRADRCHNEYQQKLSSWQRLLAPHSLNDSPSSQTSGSHDGIRW
ncbi:hypothetical protein Xen7305DRAFT_00009360 [Xenococcus sp. PCC 7305]|uniref:DUF4344 domain-containing metallopeptidase n=1 Tax=Xenococcus sp. PCC 7305 TaxID=102125 RepID=UPI0002AC8982|nr:DUF4344 domain-containing metallopeptidase [Xenococcus sp. PCC 7305]ELS01233.1 hypothetical protein Xen7305DRAFT_00009360 [Xenococcus sp. PCC 7305]